MADTIATSFGVLNYSGMLFNKGNTRTPLSSLIGGKVKTTNSTEFVVGQNYETAGGTQPEISETASLTAPDASVVTRTQMTNVTQIFQETVGISYASSPIWELLQALISLIRLQTPLTSLTFR